MRCQKCGYISFDYLSQCGKCGTDLSAIRDSLGFSSVKPSVAFFLGILLKNGKAAVAMKVEKTAPQAQEPESDIPEIDFSEEFDLDKSLADSVARRDSKTKTMGRTRSRENASSTQTAADTFEDASLILSDDDVADFIEDKGQEKEMEIDFTLEEGLSLEKTMSSPKGAPERPEMVFEESDKLKLVEDEPDDMILSFGNEDMEDLSQPPQRKKEPVGGKAESLEKAGEMELVLELEAEPEQKPEKDLDLELELALEGDLDLGSELDLGNELDLESDLHTGKDPGLEPDLQLAMELEPKPEVKTAKALEAERSPGMDASGSQDSLSFSEDLDLAGDLELDIDLGQESELLPKSEPGMQAKAKETAKAVEPAHKTDEDLVLDLTDNDLEGMLLELEESTSTAGKHNTTADDKDARKKKSEKS